MAISILGILSGILLGYYFPVSLPTGSTPYILILLCSCAYSALSGARAQSEGTFSPRVFFSRLIGNTALSAILCWLGIRLDIPVYLAPATALSYMCFKEIAIITTQGSRINQAQNQEYISKNKVEKEERM